MERQYFLRPLCLSGIDDGQFLFANLGDDLDGFSLKSLLKPLTKLKSSIDKDLKKAGKWVKEHKKVVIAAVAIAGTLGAAAYYYGGWGALGAAAKAGLMKAGGAVGAGAKWLGGAVASKGGASVLTLAAQVAVARAKARSAESQDQVTAQPVAPITIDTMGPTVPSGGGGGGMGGGGGAFGFGPESSPAPVEVARPSEPNWMLIAGLAAAGLYLMNR